MSNFARNACVDIIEWHTLLIPIDLAWVVIVLCLCIYMVTFRNYLCLHACLRCDDIRRQSPACINHLFKNSTLGYVTPNSVPGVCMCPSLSLIRWDCLLTHGGSVERDFRSPSCDVTFRDASWQSEVTRTGTSNPRFANPLAVRSYLTTHSRRQLFPCWLLCDADGGVATCFIFFFLDD